MAENSEIKLTVRGNPTQMIRAWFTIFFPVLLIVGLILKYYYNNLNISYFQVCLVIFLPLLLGVILIPMFSLTVRGGYLFYPNNILPILKSKIKISEISSVSFGRDFLPLVNPSLLTSLLVQRDNHPIVGYSIKNREGKVLGGINTKIFSDKDIDHLINTLIEINPKISR